MGRGDAHPQQGHRTVGEKARILPGIAQEDCRKRAMNIEGTIIRLRRGTERRRPALRMGENDCALWAVSGTTGALLAGADGPFSLNGSSAAATCCTRANCG